MGKIRPPRHVALAFPFTTSWLTVCTRGITDYARAHGDWSLMISAPPLSSVEEHTLTPSNLKGWSGDGIITEIRSRKEASDARRLRMPVVDLSGALAHPGHPRVTADHYAIGQLAAGHLLQCGFRRLAYYGIQGLWYSTRRGEGFRDAALKAGASCEMFEQAPPSNPRISWQQRLTPLDKWLRGLKTPVGILAVHDHRARLVVEECHRLGLNVPHDVAIIGVDNDRMVCENCRPTLSSIMRKAWEIGYRAAEMLDRLMNSEALPEQEIILPPEGIIARGSTDTLAVEDARVSAAVHYLHDHFAERTALNDVFRQVPISRRLLEKRFRRHLNCSPYAYLTQLRVEKAKQMLAAPEKMKIRVIARSCGFSNSVRMRLVFLRRVELTPLEYRRLQRDELLRKKS
ncbi:MAG: DNA-binding transcriptional regulator [Pirellulales bacterium]|nr:DNA-binding transcriptional regulator [Pirellulales bacterium]